MPGTVYVALHMIFGAVTMGLFWVTLAQVKGSPRHVRLGRLYVWSWAPILATVAGILFARAGVVYEVDDVVMFIYLTICVLAVGGSAWLAIRLRHDLERFRGPWFRILGAAITLLGLFLLVVGIAQGKPLPIAFSSVGLIYGPPMLRFAFMRAPVHPNWWLIWHLNGMCFLFNAIHGTFAAVAWRALVDPEAGLMLNVTTHFLTMAIALGLRLYFGARYDAPLRLSAPAPAAARA